MRFFIDKHTLQLLILINYNPERKIKQNKCKNYVYRLQLLVSAVSGWRLTPRGAKNAKRGEFVVDSNPFRMFTNVFWPRARDKTWMLPEQEHYIPLSVILWQKTPQHFSGCIFQFCPRLLRVIFSFFLSKNESIRKKRFAPLLKSIMPHGHAQRPGRTTDAQNRCEKKFAQMLNYPRR